jgi:hypothetical protein
LPALESVNLYATKVTDAGVARLATLGNLRRLYLWQAAVQPETTAALKEKLPNLEVVAGNWPATGDREAGGAPPRP